MALRPGAAERDAGRKPLIRLQREMFQAREALDWLASRAVLPAISWGWKPTERGQDEKTGDVTGIVLESALVAA